MHNLLEEINKSIKRGETKVYSKNLFKTGRLVRDIPSIRHKGKKYDKNARIQFTPNGIYIRDGREIAGWFKDDFELVEGVDYIIEDENA